MYDDAIGVALDSSYSNLDNKRLSLSSELMRLKKKHKTLNNLLHIYSHKAQYDVDHIKKKSFSTNINTYQNTENDHPSGVFLTTNCNNVTKLNPILNVKNKLILLKKVKSPLDTQLRSKTQYRSLENLKFSNLSHMSDTSSIPKRRENTHQKIKELNEREQKKKAQNAQRLKEVTKVLRENILMMKSKALTENFQKKLMVDTQKKLQKNSIETYKIMKKLYIRNKIEKDIEREQKVINKKEIQVDFWRSAYNDKQERKEKDKNKSVILRKLLLK